MGGRLLTETQQRMQQVRGEERHFANQSMEQLSEAMRLQQSSERTELIKEVHSLERRFEAARHAARDSVTKNEAERAVLLVATPWHAAGRQAPPDATMEASANRVDEVLNVWRAYFCRDVKMEAPFLRPHNNLILEPLRLVAGRRIAEVMLNQEPREDPVQLAVLAAKLAPPRLNMPGG